MAPFRQTSLSLILAACGLISFLSCSRAEEAGYDDLYNGDDGNAYNNRGGNDDDDGMQSYNKQYSYQKGDDYIKYWTEYAILPKRCIVYNNVDVIVFSVHPHGYQKQCTDDPLGTYIASVPYFVDGYIRDYALEMYEQGKDYEYPDAYQYVSCTPITIQNTQYYFQLGCADDSNQKLAVNIYSDKSCTKRSYVDGSDDSTIDVSKLQFPMKKCQACVNWFDLDIEVDDGYYEKHQTNAPLCQTAWSVKEECDKKCLKIGMESVDPGWNTSDKILLAILSVFGFIMLGLIVRKRQKMSNKDALLEQAAMSAAGLQQPHVIGMFILVILVVAVFALLGLKNITWALLLITNSALFGYLMKLTVDSGVSASETVIGPDGTIMRRDSDDSSMESSRDSSRRNAGTYMLPTLT